MTDNQPTASGVSDEMVEAGAKFLAPVWPGGFEDQGNLPLTYAPNDFARKIARGVLEAALSAKPAQGGDLITCDIHDRVMLKNHETGRWYCSFCQQDHDAAAPPQPIPTPDEALREALEIFEGLESSGESGRCLYCRYDATRKHQDGCRIDEGLVALRAALSRARPDATPDEAKMDYVSTRVFEGKRPISPEHAQRLNEAYKAALSRARPEEDKS